MNSTYSVLFSSSPKEKSSTFMLWCSWRPRRPKYCVRSHQTVWTRTCGLPIPRLLSDFLPSSCCRSSLAFPSRTCFELSVANDGIFVLFLCKVSVDSSNHHTKAIRVVIVPVPLLNCCVKLLEDFVQDLRFVLFDTFVIALLSSPRLPDSFSQLTTTLQLQFVTVKIQEIHFILSCLGIWYFSDCN